MLAYTNNPYKTRCSSPTYNPTTQPGCSMISGSRCGFKKGRDPGCKEFPVFSFGDSFSEFDKSPSNVHMHLFKNHGNVAKSHGTSIYLGGNPCQIPAIKL